MKSSTQTILEHSAIPRHIAVIMDGNGRWAKKRFLPRVMGHKRGLDALENMVKHCAELGVRYLTVFAFSTENWRRPEEEVSFLMGLFLQALQKQVRRLHDNNMRLKVIGSRERFNAEILKGIEAAEALTANNTGLTLSIAADYGGRWDILQAANQLIAEGATEITEEALSRYLMLGDAPEPDLFIRTGGETRISNFLLWQMAYAELYFTDTLWPDFNEKSLNEAIASFQNGSAASGGLPNSCRLSSNGVENYVETTDFNGAVALATDAGHAVLCTYVAVGGVLRPDCYVGFVGICPHERLGQAENQSLFGVNAGVRCDCLCRRLAAAQFGLVCRIGVLADCHALVAESEMEAKRRLAGLHGRLVVGDAVLVRTGLPAPSA